MAVSSVPLPLVLFYETAFQSHYLIYAFPFSLSPLRLYQMPLGRNVEVDARRHPILRLFFATLILLIVAAAAAVFGGAVWLKHAMRDSLPQLDGQFRLRGLSAAVTVRRDQHGVPHIQAATLDDLFMAQGYVTAQDRLWQMDMARRMSAGDASEVLGPTLIEHDRVERTLLMRETAEHIVANLSESDRRYLQDYARGVNIFIATNEENLPAEFRLLVYKPQPWQPVDSALIIMGMAQMLDQRWDEKLDRERVVARIGPTLAAPLYPVGSWRDHPPTQAIPDLTTPQPYIPDVPLDETQASLRGPSVNDLLHLRHLIQPARISCDGCIPGSNEWVVSGAHTASGKPILSNDMHLDYGIPNIWYESDLQAPGFHAAGVSIPGTPYITAGHNDYIAWGFTSVSADMQDLYIEQTNQQDEFRGADGIWHPIERQRQTIHVRGGRDVTIDVARTAHGPIVTPLIPHEIRTISLRWSAYNMPQNSLPVLALNTAANWTDFRAAMSRWWGPSLNVVYSDDQGHIGYQAAGQIPNRPLGIPDVPIADTNHEWQGYIPFDQLPSTLDPVGGIIATANARITPDNYSHAISNEWEDPYRNERIWKWLAGKDKLTPSDMLTLQTDVYSEVDQEIAQRLAYAIDHARNTDFRQREAADIMRTWDGTVDANSAAAAIVAAAESSFWPMLLKPKLGDDWRLYRWTESGYAREEIITHNPSGWLPAEYASWDDFLAAIVREGLRTAPLMLRSWRYGNAHAVDVEHPLYSHLPWFKRWTGTRPQPQPGDMTTVKQSGRTFGPSQRFTIDWSSPATATENIVTGQSGDPLSPYYRDQWFYWYNGQTFALPFGDAAVQSQTAHTLRLMP
jgi:penicillin G amidase